MDSIKLKEAMWLRSSRQGKKITQKELGEALYPQSKPSHQQINVSKLATGATRNYDVDMIKKICETLGVDANFLFDIKPMNQDAN